LLAMVGGVVGGWRGEAWEFSRDYTVAG
jgi:hypothetical protein